MARRKVDWTILRGTLIGFVLCVLVAATLVVASVYFQRSMEREYQRHHARFRAASQQYLAVDEEERAIEEYYPAFVRLVRAGLIGPERRLSWLETLRTTGDRLRVPDLVYKLDARREWQPDFDLALGGYTLYVSPMNLSLGLAHEGDLLALFEALTREARGQYTVRSCDLRAPEAEVSYAAQAINVRAECRLDWITLDLAGGRELAL